MVNLDKLKKLKCGKIESNVNLLKYNTYRVSAVASYMAFPENEKDLIKLIGYLKENNVKYKILGGGANLIFENDYDGVLIKLDYFDKLVIDDTKIKVGAGYNLIKLALKVSKLGLTGMEFASGIPGTVGGAIFNNAGAYKSDMGYIVESITVLTPNLEIKKMYNKELNFHYRTSFLKENEGYICLSANIILKHGKKDEILSVIEDRKQRRLMAQPLEYPSAGSVFRNPEGNFAGKLIEDIGYKGKNIGGAKVSEKHANFIINEKNATGKEIVKLIEEIKSQVKKEYNIDLILEQEIVK
ncbi:MAG: UDP-N-acetylmuramate dehydrogenase [Lactobacillales bacterium]|nr:UDP-N-acetylmuramate dehydrogenase [Lactobacillales bacterium]